MDEKINGADWTSDKNRGETMDAIQVEERIKALAKNTDGLIVKLDTLSNRIDTARANDNQELIEYYERQFSETSVEFMNGVETILDEWYALKGTDRPPADRETISPETLDEIHNTVVAIVQGVSAQANVTNAQSQVMIDAGAEQPVTRSTKDRNGPGGKVDITG
jgi:hypothetical protein